MYEALMRLQSDVAAAIDDDQWEEWPRFFTETCFYRITTLDNHLRGLEAGLVYADSRQMLVDRILSLRKANIYEKQRYRHLVSVPRIREQSPDVLRTETGFAVLRTVRGGATEAFASGRYLDDLVQDGDGALQLQRRDVVCDSSRIDTLLAIPL